MIATFTLIMVANLYLTGFNIYRVALRYAKARADYEEAIRDKAKAMAEQAELELAETAMRVESTTSVAA